MHVVEHPVERGTDPADLGVRIGLGLRDALLQGHLAAVQREFGDAGGGRGDLAQRAGGDADEDPAGDARGDETGGRDADLDEDQRPDRAVGVRGRDGDVVTAVGAAGVPDAVVAEARDLHGVFAAVPRDGRERGALGGAERLDLHLRDVVVVLGLVADLGVGDGAVRERGGDGAGRLGAAGDELGEVGAAALAPVAVLAVGVLAVAVLPGAGVLAAGVLAAGVLSAGVLSAGVLSAGVLAAARRAGAVLEAVGRDERPGRPCRDLLELAVELVVEMRVQCHGRHGPDHRADHGDQRERGDDEPRPQGARLTRQSFLRTRPPSPAHDTAGLIR